MSQIKKLIGDYMSEQVHAIDENENVATAKEQMTRWGIRHLPVLSDGKLKGVLSDRDIKAAAALKGFNAKQISVSDICTQPVFVSHPDSALSVVASKMAEEKYGCTVITAQNDEVVGIFSATDACRALGEVLASVSA